jgi:heptosyltransferase-2
MLGFYRTYTTPFKVKITTSVDDYFRRVSIFRRFTRFIGRYLYAEIALRKNKKIDKITGKHQRILWIQWVDSYLGDSLMDLSSRVLIRDKKVDLLTKENVAKIYQGDIIFSNIYSDPKQCVNNDYDLIIIDSYRQRGLKVITQYFPFLPYVSLYGYYNVDDFNRLYFSFHRVNQWLLKPYDNEYIESIAKPSLPISSNDVNVVENFQLPDDYITIAIGGANQERTFHLWTKLINKIRISKISDNIVLIGSEQAKNEAKLILKNASGVIFNMVGECTFQQSAQIIKKSTMLICADGGLLHASNAVETPVIGLFYYINPEVRLIALNKSYGLMNKENIDNISVSKIVEKIKLLKEELK